MMIPFVLWSYLLTVLGGTALFLAGSGKPIGWAVGIIDELAWLIYSYQTHQWGFIPGSFIYIIIFIRNYKKSQRSVKEP